MMRKRWFILLCLLTFAWGCQSTPTFEGSLLEPPLEVADFELQDTDGNLYRLSDSPDKIKLFYFGYTFCPDVCPLTLSDVKETLDDFENRDQVEMVFVSVDPERDTPEALDRYMNAFGDDFIGLTDELTKVDPILKSFGAYYEKVETENSAANYLVNHTSRLYLVVPGQGIKLTYPYGFTPEQLRADLTYLTNNL